MIVRYINRYRKENGRWLFSSRVVAFDHHSTQANLPAPEELVPTGAADPSYKALVSRLFARGPRA